MKVGRHLVLFLSVFIIFNEILAEVVNLMNMAVHLVTKHYILEKFESNTLWQSYCVQKCKNKCSG